MGNIREAYNCQLELTMDIIGGKWKMLVLWYLRNGVVRYGELKKCIPDITHRMLTQQLRDLEGSEMLVRTVYPVVPPKVEYSLTEHGMALVPILSQISTWAGVYAHDKNIAVKSMQDKKSGQGYCSCVSAAVIPACSVISNSEKQS